MAGPNIRRLYYSTREVCRRVGITPSILRDWEDRFPEIRPSRSQSGRRLYKASHLELIQKIRRFKEIGYTDEKIGALLHGTERQEMLPRFSERPSRRDLFPLLEEIRTALQEILDLLGPPSERR